MQPSVLVTQIMPLALGIIMLGLGLSLTLGDFLRVRKYPLAVTISLGSQMILLPAMCFALASVSGLSTEMAVGLVLLAASPGGATASLYSYLFGGDVALNITLTAVNCVLTLFTLPLLTNLAMEYFMGSGQYVPMPFQKVIEVFTIVLSPVALGMLIKRFSPGFAQKMEKPVKIASAVFLALIILTVTIQQKDMLRDHILTAGVPVILFSVLSLSLGYWLPRLAGIAKAQSIASGMEIGIHNATLSLYISLNVLHNGSMSVPPALYGLIMFFTAAAFGWIVKPRAEEVTSVRA